MRLPPRFWTSHETWMPGPEGRELRLELWGWSDESQEAAAQHARSRVERLVAHLGSRGGPAWDEYYPTGPVREPVLAAYDATGAEVGPATPPDQVRAFLTRTRYGAVVLNTDAVVFVDVDLPDVVAPPTGGGIGSRIARFLGFAGDPEPAPDLETSGEQAALHRIRGWAARHPHLGVRTYRTKAGFRVLVTGTGFGPTDPRTATLLAELGSDPLYARLCAAQQSFRARLTPKPWRVGVLAAGTRWPFRDASDQQRFERWLPQYEAASQSSSVCSLVESVGQPPSAQEQTVVLVHDVWTGVESPLPLA